LRAHHLGTTVIHKLEFLVISTMLGPTDEQILKTLSVAEPAVVIKPVSADSLRRFFPQDRRTETLETKSNARKAGFSGSLSRFLGNWAKRRNA
jgi:hypothetical protein